MSETPPRVQFHGISKHYPGVQALDDVSFSVGPGSIHALVGENGAGKSTLVKIIAGATRADRGSVLIDGQVASIRNTRAAAAMGIAVVHQEFSLAADLNVSENVFLGRWPRGPLGFISTRRLREGCGELLESLGVRISPRADVRGLSAAQQQIVEIARALSLQAGVLVLDEPSAVLTPPELEALFAIVRRLAAQGVSIIYVSHRLDEVFELCDSVTVLRDGVHVSTRSIDRTSRDSLIEEMVGRPLVEEFPRRHVRPGRSVLRVKELSASGRFQAISFEVRSSEVLALTGLIGSGRSSVGKALFGAVPGIRGEVHLDGIPGMFSSPREAMRRGVAYLPEDRRRQGLLIERPLRENLSLSNLSDYSTAGFLRLRRERRRVAQAMREFQIKAAGPGVLTKTLSGGNQQKILIARWLQRPCRVVILDEPTRGVDVGAKVEIYAMLNRMAATGAAVLLITSELSEAVGMADRIAVMADGLLVGILDQRERTVTPEMILRLAIGPHRAPHGRVANGSQA